MARCNSRRPELLARGHVSEVCRTQMMRSNVYLTPEIFEQIRELAIAEGLSFSSTLRGVIVDGLGRRLKEAA